MPIFANTILAGHWPYHISFFLSPLVLALETMVLRRRHRDKFTWGNALAAVFVANVISFLAGSITNQGDIRGLEMASATVSLVSSIAWAWCFSVVTEYAVLRLWFKDIGWQQGAITAALMNLASYVLIITPAMLWIFFAPH